MNAQGCIIEVMLGGLSRCIAPTRRLRWKKNLFQSSTQTQDWTCLGRGHYSSWILVRGGQNVDTIPVTPWAIIYVRPGPFFRYGTGVNHYQMWLNIVVKFVKIPYLLTSKKVEGPLSKLLCICRKDDQRYSNVCNVKKYLSSLRVYLSSHP